jgi:hypothetical protein
VFPSGHAHLSDLHHSPFRQGGKPGKIEKTVWSGRAGETHPEGIAEYFGFLASLQDANLFLPVTGGVVAKLLNHRLLSVKPPASATTGFRRLHLCRCGGEMNYRFLTPSKQDFEFQIQSSEVAQNQGVRNG